MLPRFSELTALFDEARRAVQIHLETRTCAPLAEQLAALLTEGTT